MLLFDPLAPPKRSSSLPLTAGRPSATCPWHERDTQSLAERLSAPVSAPPPDQGSPDVAWPLASDTVEGHLFSAGDQLPVGVEAFPEKEPNDVALWVESRRAAIAGDTLVDFGQGLEVPAEWLPMARHPSRSPRGAPAAQRPVEHVLATDGGPTDRAALGRALS